jgi:hypothetical protein
MNDTEPVPGPTPEAAGEAPSAPPASIARAIGNQRRAIMLAAGLVVAAIWITIPLGEWRIGVFLAAGFVLGLVNHVGTEYALQKAIATGDPMTRQMWASSSLLRLAVVSIAGFAIAAIFWSDGAAVIFGIAIFHLVALTLTAIPLLREVRKG